MNKKLKSFLNFIFRTEIPAIVEGRPQGFADSRPGDEREKEMPRSGQQKREVDYFIVGLVIFGFIVGVLIGHDLAKVVFCD